ncbi:Sec-independent protein translocase subunit TatB [Streptomyces sp. J2-1]|uniref:sec-independent translocase n=1 Tax=Streptomyces corallincola TaxID=2851888 RepID=UPI001C38E5D5|nr:sec-independent translocase [Streptomyces corallincola]MBV2354133.1 Sec-independent protein translocase subunit TatB [Streptomyces corallincola]
MFSDVGPLELLTLAVLAVLVFGPDKLPKMIQNVAGVLRKLRELSESAKTEIRSELGPEYQDFDFEDLRPKTFVRKHLLNGETEGLGLEEIRSALDPRAELDQIAGTVREAADDTRTGVRNAARVPLTKTAGPEPVAERSAFDIDAT